MFDMRSDVMAIGRAAHAARPIGSISRSDVRRRRTVLLVSMAALGAIAFTGCQEIVGSGSSGQSTLHVVWKVQGADAGSSSYWLGRPATAEGRVFFEDGNSMVGMDAGTGNVLWRRPVRHAAAPPPTAPIAANGRVYLSETDSVLAMDAKTGETIWNFHPDSQAIVFPAIDDHALYTGQRGIPIVYALDLTTGQPLWKTNLGVDYQYGAYVKGLTVARDTVYATVTRDLVANGAQSSGVLVALDRQSGHILWRYETTGTPHGFADEPVLAGAYVVVADVLGHGVVAIDRSTATEAWHVTSPSNGPATSPLLSGNTLFVPMLDGSSIAVDAASGRTIWQQQIGSSALGGTLCGPALFINNEEIQRRDTATGALTGRLSMPSTQLLSSNLASDGTRVFVSGVSALYAVSCGV